MAPEYPEVLDIPLPSEAPRHKLPLPTAPTAKVRDNFIGNNCPASGPTAKTSYVLLRTVSKPNEEGTHGHDSCEDLKPFPSSVFLL